MSTNKDIAAILDEMASILEITGANPFRINAHRRASRVIGDLTRDLADHVASGEKLTTIDGIGTGIAGKITQFIEQGQVTEHKELLASIPPGLLDVMTVPGLGPKTIRTLWEKAAVTDLATLQAAVDDGRLEDLPRMGRKTIANIAESLAFLEATGGRERLGTVMPLAEEMIAQLKSVPGVEQVTFAGSLRRGLETIGDIDILAATSDPEGLAEAFCTQEGVTGVLASGDTKCSIRHAKGLQVDLRIVPGDSWGAALMYFTGSKEHNVRLRERAQARDMRLNEYGLFPGGNAAPEGKILAPVASKTEDDIYRALDLSFIAPELREDRGELDGVPDRLVTIEDIKSELHAHTIASDGILTIRELAEEALGRGFHAIAVTDHSGRSAQANGLGVDRLLGHIDDVHAVNDALDGITVLAGSEVDILPDGTLDYPDEILAQLDIVVASPHVSLRQSSKVATDRLLKAISNPHVHIIGHPTGRIINRRRGLEPDMDRLISAAAEHNKALEINANPLRLDLRDSHVRGVVDAGGLIAINTDAHAADHFDFLRYGILTARRGGLSPDACINCWSADRLQAWLRASR